MEPCSQAFPLRLFTVLRMHGVTKDVRPGNESLTHSIVTSVCKGSFESNLNAVT